MIDTQSLLDWQLFANPCTAGWTLPADRPHGWQWIATTAMREELVHVLGRHFAAQRATPAQAVLDFFDGHARILAAPTWPDTRSMRCTDPDDQKFIDLACASHARWLISRDKAVLRLAKRAMSLRGVEIIPPSVWQPP